MPTPNTSPTAIGLLFILYQRISLNLPIISQTNNLSVLAAAAFSLRESFARRYGRVGDFLPNDGSRAPKVQGGVNGYLSVM